MALILSAKDPLATINVTFSFASILGVETLTAASQTVTVALHAGADPTPSGILSGDPVISGTTVLQKVTGGVAGADYYLRCSVGTNGARTLVIAAVLPVRNA
jgi:hypothetical protein